MMYLLMFVMFLLVMQFAFAFLPYLLPVMLIFWLVSLFRKPNIKVYTHTYSYGGQDDAASPFGSSFAQRTPKEQITLRKPLEDSIDAEFTEVKEYDIEK